MTPIRVRRADGRRRRAAAPHRRPVRDRERGARRRTSPLALRDIARRAGVPYVFKASFDKANRTSARRSAARDSTRGCACSPASARQPACRSSPTSTSRRRRRAPPRSPTSCRFPAFLVAPDRPARRRGGDRPGREPQEGPVPRARRHAPRDRQGHGAGNRASSSPSAASRFGYHNLVVDMRAFPIMRALRLPGRLRRHPQPAAAGRGRRRHRRAGGVHRADGLGRRRGRRRRRLHGSPRGAGAGEERRAERAAARSARSAARTAWCAFTPSPHETAPLGDRPA